MDEFVKVSRFLELDQDQVVRGPWRSVEIRMFDHVQYGNVLRGWSTDFGVVQLLAVPFVRCVVITETYEFSKKNQVESGFEYLGYFNH